MRDVLGTLFSRVTKISWRREMLSCRWRRTTVIAYTSPEPIDPISGSGTLTAMAIYVLKKKDAAHQGKVVISAMGCCQVIVIGCAQHCLLVEPREKTRCLGIPGNFFLYGRRLNMLSGGLVYIDFGILAPSQATRMCTCGTAKGMKKM